MGTRKQRQRTGAESVLTNSPARARAPVASFERACGFGQGDHPAEQQPFVHFDGDEFPAPRKQFQFAKVSLDLQEPVPLHAKVDRRCASAAVAALSLSPHSSPVAECVPSPDRSTGPLSGQR
jgi:hypothetical protein